MKGSIFDNATGSFLYYGSVNNSKYNNFLAQGHIGVDNVFGGSPDWLMWDSVAATVVPDMARRNQDTQDVQDKADRAARKIAIQAELAVRYQDHTGTVDEETIDLLNELARLYA